MLSSSKDMISLNLSKNINDIDGLLQERRNSIADALELRLSCTNLSICSMILCHAV